MAVILDFYPVIRRMQYNLYARGLQELDIDIANHHATIMKMLQESGTLSSIELGKELFVSRSQMSHSTKKLMKMGLVEKRPNLIDRRKVKIALTPKGEAEIQKMDTALLDLIHERVLGLSNDDLEKLTESFENIVQVFAK